MQCCCCRRSSFVVVVVVAVVIVVVVGYWLLVVGFRFVRNMARKGWLYMYINVSNDRGKVNYDVKYKVAVVFCYYNICKYVGHVM